MHRPPSTASMMISREVNQSWLLPRSSIICNAPIPVPSTTKPSQSKRRWRSLSGSCMNNSNPSVASRPNGRLM